MHRDRLSELPLPLILHILSFLPITYVVRTTLLSKHWVNLWTTVPSLTIDDNYNEDFEDGTSNDICFLEFVKQALRLWKGTKIHKFTISISCHSSIGDHVYAWTLFALKNKVEELIISYYDEFWVPHDLYSCSSITRLSLDCDVGLFDCVVEFCGTPSWNQLKSLTLKPMVCDCNFEDFLNIIMLGSPVLEVLDLDMEYCPDHWENLNIMSRSLKWLEISCYRVQFGKPLRTLSFCCPNLKTLNIYGLFKCLFTDVSSLCDATLFFYNGDNNRGSMIELLGETLNQFFSAIQNVEKLVLTDVCVQVLGALRKKYLLSPLPNVKFLKLRVLQYCIEFGDVIDLLGIFPNLKYFTFDGRSFRKPHVFNTVNYMEFETNISKSLLLQLKIVKIKAHAQLFDSSVFGFIKCLLKHAVMLEKLVIWPEGITLVEYKRFSKKLLSMPRSSPTARVIL